MTDGVRFLDSRWEIEYSHTAGAGLSRFLVGLREGVLLAQRCPACERAFLPPRPLCGDCYAALDEWVEVGPEGTVVAITEVRRQYPMTPAPPFVVALVRPDGADSALAQHVIGPGAAQLQPGGRVRAVFHDDREARITDFHFEPLAGESA